MQQDPPVVCRATQITVPARAPASVLLRPTWPPTLRAHIVALWADWGPGGQCCARSATYLAAWENARDDDEKGPTGRPGCHRRGFLRWPSGTRGATPTGRQEGGPSRMEAHVHCRRGRADRRPEPARGPNQSEALGLGNGSARSSEVWTNRDRSARSPMSRRSRRPSSAREVGVRRARRCRPGRRRSATRTASRHR